MNAQQIRAAIEATHSHIGFSRFALDMKNLSADQSQALLSMPEIGGKCRVRLQPMAKMHDFLTNNMERIREVYAIAYPPLTSAKTDNRWLP